MKTAIKDKKPTKLQKEKAILSSTKDLVEQKKDLLDLQKELVSKEQDLRELTLSDEPLPLELKIKFAKIRELRTTMSYCFGQGPFGALQETMIRPMFNEEDLYEYKAKLQKLIKDL